MKKLLLALVMVGLLTGTAFAKGGGSVHVSGYVTKNGTYVAPHERTAPNGTTSDNWSTKGNVNPYTGKEGTKEPGVGSGGSVNGYIWTGNSWVPESTVVAPIPAQTPNTEPRTTAEWSLYADTVFVANYADLGACVARSRALADTTEGQLKVKYDLLANPYNPNIKFTRTDASFLSVVSILDGSYKYVESHNYRCKQVATQTPAPVVQAPAQIPTSTQSTTQTTGAEVQAPAQVPTSTLGRPSKENWRKIRSGMSREQVEALLGEPVRISPTSFGTKYHMEYPSIHPGQRGYVILWNFNNTVDMWSE